MAKKPDYLLLKKTSLPVTLPKKSMEQFEKTLEVYGLTKAVTFQELLKSWLDQKRYRKPMPLRKKFNNTVKCNFSVSERDKIRLTVKCRQLGYKRSAAIRQMINNFNKEMKL